MAQRTPSPSTLLSPPCPLPHRALPTPTPTPPAIPTASTPLKTSTAWLRLAKHQLRRLVGPWLQIRRGARTSNRHRSSHQTKRPLAEPARKRLIFRQTLSKRLA